MHDRFILFRMVPTMRCNYRCDYCFVSEAEKSSGATLFDIHSPAEWVRAMANWRDYEVEFYFWGGEPFLLDGTYELVRGWTDYPHVISGSRIDTNMFFAKKIAQRCPTDKLKLNCFWHTKYESLCSIIAKVERLHGLGMVGMVNFVASYYNLNVLRNRYFLTVDELVRIFDDMGVFLNVAADFSIVNGKSPHTYRDYKEMILTYLCPEDWKQLRCEKTACLCEANKHYFTVHANGDITPCLSDKVCGNFFAGTLEFAKNQVCHERCPSLVAYGFREDNDFPFKRHLVEYVKRNRAYREARSACLVSGR